MKRYQPLDGEKIIIEESLHWKNFIFPATVMSLVLILFLIRCSFKQYNLVNILFNREVFSTYWVTFISTFEQLLMLVIMGMMFYKILTISSTKYILTNKRIISISGVYNVFQQEMLLNRCEMVYMNQNAYENIYKCGSILCVSAGASLLLEDVSNAYRFKQTILNYLANNRNSHDLQSTN